MISKQIWFLIDETNIMVALSSMVNPTVSHDFTLPRVLNGESNGAIKMFGYKIFNLYFIDVEPGVTS